MFPLPDFKDLSILKKRYNAEYSETSKPRSIFVTLRACGYISNFTYGWERVDVFVKIWCTSSGQTSVVELSTASKLL